MDFIEIILSCIKESNTSGGAGSAFGSGVASTATSFSGDTYAPKDSRVPCLISKKVITRRGLNYNPNNKKTQRKKPRKK